MASKPVDREPGPPVRPRFSTKACPEHGDTCKGVRCCCVDKHDAHQWTIRAETVSFVFARSEDEAKFAVLSGQVQPFQVTVTKAVKA